MIKDETTNVVTYIDRYTDQKSSLTDKEVANEEALFLKQMLKIDPDVEADFLLLEKVENCAESLLDHLEEFAEERHLIENPEASARVARLRIEQDKEEVKRIRELREFRKTLMKRSRRRRGPGEFFVF